MRIIKKSLLATSASSIALFASSVVVFAQTEIRVDRPEPIANVNADASTIITFVINLFIVLGIVFALMFLLWGGIRWIMSGGDKGKVDSARGTIVAAIVGLVIVILAWIIINTVLSILGVGSLSSGFTIPSLSSPEPTPAG